MAGAEGQQDRSWMMKATLTIAMKAVLEKELGELE